MWTRDHRTRPRNAAQTTHIVAQKTFRVGPDQLCAVPALSLSLSLVACAILRIIYGCSHIAHRVTEQSRENARASVSTAATAAKFATPRCRVIVSRECVCFLCVLCVPNQINPDGDLSIEARVSSKEL